MRAEKAEPKLPPAAVDAFSQADLLGREPFSHHANAEYKAGAHDRKQQAGHHQLVEILSEGEQQAGESRKNQQRRVGEAGPVLVEQHSNQDAGRYGEGHVADCNGANLGHREAQISLDGGRQRRQVKPDNKSKKERKPGEMQRLVSPLERPEFTEHVEVEL